MLDLEIDVDQFPIFHEISDPFINGSLLKTVPLIFPALKSRCSREKIVHNHRLDPCRNAGIVCSIIERSKRIEFELLQRNVVSRDVVGKSG